jgi:transcriptional regulator with XRE-family HTH domain
MMKTNLGEQLGLLRRAMGQSQSQAAAKLGVSQALLSHYENGSREPKLEFIVKLCDYYGVSADYLIGRTPNPRQAEDFTQTLDEVSELIAKLRGD